MLRLHVLIGLVLLMPAGAFAQPDVSEISQAYRTQVYETFHQRDRTELKRRLEAGKRAEQAYRQYPFDGPRNAILAWYRQAIYVSRPESIGPLPYVPAVEYFVVVLESSPPSDNSNTQMADGSNRTDSQPESHAIRPQPETTSDSMASHSPSQVAADLAYRTREASTRERRPQAQSKHSRTRLSTRSAVQPPDTEKLLVAQPQERLTDHDNSMPKPESVEEVAPSKPIEVLQVWDDTKELANPSVKDTDEPFRQDGHDGKVETERLLSSDVNPASDSDDTMASDPILLTNASIAAQNLKIKSWRARSDEALQGTGLDLQSVVNGLGKLLSSERQVQAQISRIPHGMKNRLIQPISIDDTIHDFSIKLQELTPSSGLSDEKLIQFRQLVEQLVQQLAAARR